MIRYSKLSSRSLPVQNQHPYLQQQTGCQDVGSYGGLHAKVFPDEDPGRAQLRVEYLTSKLNTD